MLPDEQRGLWPALARVPKSFVLYGAQFPPMEAVKTLTWFEIDDARNVGAATRELLSRTAASWRCAVSAIAKSEDRRLGP